jgi:hypothetical protein
MSSGSTLQELEARLPKTNQEKSQQIPVDQSSQASSSAERLDRVPETQPYTTIIIQATACCLFLVLLFLRKYQVSIIGYTPVLVFGSIPAECLLFGLVLLSLQVRDLGRSIAALGHRKDRGFEKDQLRT